MKPYFLYSAAAASAVLALLCAGFALTVDGGTLAWWAAAVSNLPLPLFVARLFVGRVVRTSDNLPLLLLIAAGGVVIAFWEGVMERTAPYSAPGIALAGLSLLLLYVFWYSRFGRIESSKLVVGGELPELEWVDLEGRPVRSADLRGRPLVLMFYEHNGCSFCVNQVREIAQRSEELGKLGIGLRLVSAQAAGQTRKLAEASDADPGLFLVDLDNRSAEMLAIASHSGGWSGAPSGKALPTVIVVNSNGRILYADQTDNYRVRPEPDVYISLLKRSGALVT